MEDSVIVELYWQRDERAISETANRYNGYCYSIAYNILSNREDAEESVSDTWLAAWNSIPPHRPNLLATFLGKITRHISIDRWRSKGAAKRGGGQVTLALEELSECLSDGNTMDSAMERKEVLHQLNRFLDGLSKTERSVFLCRYWYLDSVGTIAKNFSFSETKVTSMLYRLRQKFRKQLEKEGF